MKPSEVRKQAALNRYLIYRMKLQELMHLHVIWFALMQGEFEPKNLLNQSSEDFANTLRTVCLSWFSILVDRGDGLDIFELWLVLFPKHKRKIISARNEVMAGWQVLREYRDKVGFHGDKPRRYFRARTDAVRRQKDIVASIQKFLDLTKFLILREPAELPEFVSNTETLLLDLELELQTSIERKWFKRALILPDAQKYRQVFG